MNNISKNTNNKIKVNKKNYIKNTLKKKNGKHNRNKT